MNKISSHTVQTEKLSLLSAILININIMLGTGVFVNTVLLTTMAGALGALVYALVGLLILPLILTFSHLLAYHPGGTFYEFGARISPVWGFLSSWSYFVGKLATSALGIHVFVILLQQFSPALASVSSLILSSIILGLFVLLNMFDLKTGQNINYLFVILKSIPILFVICTAFFLFNIDHFAPETFMWGGITCCAPFVLFAFAGFEASCSLSKSIENPTKNGPKAILISYIITIITMISYQLGFFGVMGNFLGSLPGFQNAFPVIVQQVFPTTISAQLLFKVLTMSGVAASSLGSSYGVIYSNIWNLYTLADKKHTFAVGLVAKKNRYNTPFVCVLITGLIVFAYLFLTGGYQVPLQQISATAVTIAYTISAVSFMATSFLITKSNRVLALMGVASCLLLITSVFFNAHRFGAQALLAYGLVILAGVVMFYLVKPRKNRTTNTKNS